MCGHNLALGISKPLPARTLACTGACRSVHTCDDVGEQFDRDHQPYMSLEAEQLCIDPNVFILEL